MIRAVRNIHQEACEVYGHAGRLIETGARPESVDQSAAPASQCCHVTAGRDEPHGIVLLLCDVNIASIVDGNGGGVVELGARGRTVDVAHAVASGKRRHDACWRNHADSLIAIVSDIHIARRIQCQSTRRVKRGAGADPVREAYGTPSQSGSHRTPRRKGYHTDRVVSTLGHVQIASRVHGYTVRTIERRKCACAVRKASEAVPRHGRH